MALTWTQSPCPSSGSDDNCDRENHAEKDADEETSNYDLEKQEEGEERISIDEEEPLLLKKAKKNVDPSAVTPHIKKV